MIRVGHLAELAVHAKSLRMDYCPVAYLTKHLYMVINAALIVFHSRMQTDGWQIIIGSSYFDRKAPALDLRTKSPRSEQKKIKSAKNQGQSTKMKIRKCLVPRPAKVAWERDYNTTVSLLQLLRPFA